jgi:hypothetical protein
MNPASFLVGEEKMYLYSSMIFFTFLCYVARPYEKAMDVDATFCTL